MTGELLKRGADLIAKAREAQDRRSALLQKLRRMEEVSPLALRVDAARATKAQSQEREAPRGDEFQMAEDMEFIREDISVG